MLDGGEDTEKGFIKRKPPKEKSISRSPETRRNPGFLAPIRFEDLRETLAGSGILFVTGSCVPYKLQQRILNQPTQALSSPARFSTECTGP
jgi:hypothetical protein